MNAIFYSFMVMAFLGMSFTLAYLGKVAELAGFVVAGAFSLFFLKLDSFKEFSGGGISAKLKDRIDSLEADLEPIKIKETEPEAEEKDRVLNEELPEYGVDSDPEKDDMDVLFAITNSKFSWRTAGGIKADTKLSMVKVKKALQRLQFKGLVMKTERADGKSLWSGTKSGFEYDQNNYPK